jgi:hypothetical protein
MADHFRGWRTLITGDEEIDVDIADATARGEAKVKG